MQAQEDYERGLAAARADAKHGWARCWMPAAQLAEEAVYSSLGLSDEQLGYAAGLDEAFPGGLAEIGGFLPQLHTGMVLVLGPEARLEPPVFPVAVMDGLATVVVEEKPSGQRPGARWQWGRRRAANVWVPEPFQYLKKRRYVARFVYVYTHIGSR